MLILTRRTNEKIIIGEEVYVTVLGVDHRGQVRIGIDAPEAINIVREELIRDITNGDDPYAYMTEPETNPSSKQGERNGDP